MWTAPALPSRLMPLFLATYIHNLSPFAIRFSERFGIRWYGLAYVLGFICAYFLLRWFVRLKACELKENEVADFMTMSALFGVMLGGRLGYQLLYNSAEFFANPLVFFNFLGGGMASHGGIIGLTLFALVYCRYKKISWPGLGDNLVVVSPLGVFFGRIANFINGELYGRETERSIAMKFPDELHDLIKTDGGAYWKFSTERLQVFADQCKDIAPGLKSEVANILSANPQAHGSVVNKIIATAHSNPEVLERLGGILTPRHPSQLYEALIEGLLLFLFLLAIRLKWKNLYHGVLTGIFFITYACGRILVERYREPDADLIMGITRGQFYSTFMILIGIAFLIYGFKVKRRNRLRE